MFYEGYIGVYIGIMENQMETTIMGLYRDYRVYIGVILGYWKIKWTLLFRVKGLGLKGRDVFNFFVQDARLLPFP